MVNFSLGAVTSGPPVSTLSPAAAQATPRGVRPVPCYRPPWIADCQFLNAPKLPVARPRARIVSRVTPPPSWPAMTGAAMTGAVDEYRHRRPRRATDNRAASRSAPARLLAQIDAQSGLGHDLVHQECVGRMEPAAAGVTEQPLQLVGAEHAGAARHFHRQVDDPPACLDSMVLGRDELRRPGPAVVHPVRPVVRH